MREEAFKWVRLLTKQDLIFTETKVRIALFLPFLYSLQVSILELARLVHGLYKMLFQVLRSRGSHRWF